jgi:CheY-like chemotaxis protein
MDHYKILLIDDDAMSSTYTSLILKKIRPKVEVVYYNNAQDALCFLKNELEPKPNYIFLDLNMPGMSGWDFMDEFQKLNLNIEVIITTSSNDIKDRDRSKSYSGISDFFVKPIGVENTQTLFNRVQI